jgi:hypothetical protein
MALNKTINAKSWETFLGTSDEGQTQEAETFGSEGNDKGKDVKVLPARFSHTIMRAKEALKNGRSSY